MSEPKFTPGPWQAVDGLDIIAADDWVVAVATGGEDDSVANANLIAAAPDLYAALEKAFALVEALMPGLAKISVKDYRAVNETPSEIRAALAKARGETAGCPLDTDGDGNCHAHPAGCPPLIRGLLAFLAISLVISCTSVSKRANPQHWRREQQLAAAAGCCLLWNPCSFMGFPPHLTNSSLMHAQSSKEDQ